MWGPPAGFAWGPPNPSTGEVRYVCFRVLGKCSSCHFLVTAGNVSLYRSEDTVKTRLEMLGPRLVSYLPVL